MINEDILYAYGFQYESLTGSYDMEVKVNDVFSLIRLRASGYYFVVDISGFAYPIKTEQELIDLLCVCGVLDIHKCPNNK